MTEWNERIILCVLQEVQAQYECSQIDEAFEPLEQIIIRRKMAEGANAKSNQETVIFLRDRGWTMHEIAPRVHLSYPRIQQICKEEHLRREMSFYRSMNWKRR
jgi:hypothetical protein